MDALLTPTAPSAAFAQGENMDDPVKMYLNDVFTVPANMAGVPRHLGARPGWTRTGCRSACRCLSRPFDEETGVRGRRAIEQRGRVRRVAAHPRRSC